MTDEEDRPDDGDVRTVKVLFTVGKGRSGSTLFGSLLGAVDGMFNGGELRRLWEWGLTHGYLCGCGVPVPECPFWREVLARLEETGPVPAPERAAELTRRVTSWWNVHTLVGEPRRALRRWRGAEDWTALMRRLYEAVADVTGAGVVVDTTKVPVNPVLLGPRVGIDVYVVQLVRDPRAVTHSWKRHKEWTDREEGGEMPRYGAVYTGGGWLLRNGASELARRRLPRERSMTLRYEDLMDGPRPSTDRVLELVGMAGATTPFTDERTVELPMNHAVAGNPDRVGRREVTIREDVEWRERIGRRDALVTTVLAAPLLRRYGYPWRV